MRKHVVITGTGRAGTSYLVELLTFLGLDTGFTPESVSSLKDSVGRAGLEHNILHDNCPYIIKSPWFCDVADEVLQRDDINIVHVFVPIRHLQAAAESRRFVTQSGSVYGGLWHTDSQEEGVQEGVLANQFYKLMLALSKTDIQVTLLNYPRITQDPVYLYNKLLPILPNVAIDTFLDVFNKVVQPDLVHTFSDKDS